MPSESLIRKKAINILKEAGFVCWFAPKAKFRESDAFGIWDLICGKKDMFRWIQLTTKSNMSARKHKIDKVLKETKLDFGWAEIWGWDAKNKIFKIVEMQNRRRPIYETESYKQAEKFAGLPPYGKYGI